jgi:pimeloyl-ACP methyl ester carboxylesterase
MSGKIEQVSVVSVVSRDGTRIVVRTGGSGPPLVIMPGTLAPAALYQALADLLESRKRVLTVERRGYGVSETGPRPCRTASNAYDLIAVLESLDRRAVVFGHSFGGVAALEAACEAPEHFDKLVIYEPPAALLGAALVPMLETCRRFVELGRADEAVLTALPLRGAGAQPGESMRELAGKLGPLAVGLLCDLECATAMTVIPDRWSDITVPVTLLGGGASGPEYVASVAMLRGLLPGAHYAVLADQAHFPQDMTALAEYVA